MKYPSTSVICHASCLGDLSGFFRASCLCPARVHNLVTNEIRDPVPELPGSRFEISHTLKTFILVSLVPALVEVLADTFTATELGDGVITPHAFENYADLFFS